MGGGWSPLPADWEVRDLGFLGWGWGWGAMPGGKRDGWGGRAVW